VAAIVAGRGFRFSWPEIGVMSGLSGSQAAATLATTLVGAKLGLFDKQTINAVLVVILVSLVVTPAVVSFFGKRVTSDATETAAIGKSVLVPVWGASSRPALTLAGQLASEDGGIVLPASFGNESSSAAELTTQRSLGADAEAWLAKEGLESKRLFRVARTVPEGLLQAVEEESASLLVSEWRTPRLLETDSEVSKALARSPVPMLFAQGEVGSFGRLVVIVRREELEPARRKELEVAAALGTRMARKHRMLTVSPTLHPVRALFAAKQEMDWVESSDPIDWLVRQLADDDLPLFVGIEAAREAIRRVPKLAQGRFLVAAAASTEKAADVAKPVASPVTVGRSLKPRPA
jgi:hypothetical protein